MAPVSPRLAMLGPAPQARDGAASLVEAYRAQGLLKGWPIDYFATYGAGSALRDAQLLARSLRRFAGLLARERGLVVHLHAAPERGLWRDLPFLAATRAAQCPYILHLHGTGFRRAHEDGGRPMRFMIRAALGEAACVIVPCESMKSWVRCVARGANVLCVPYPVAPAEPQPQLVRPNLVVFLGRLEAAKGVYDLLEAISGLRPAVPDVRLLCAGEGDRGAITAYAERLGIADAVKFTGWVGPSGKRALLENAAVFALPSYDEALPMSLLEAMAAGAPVVASPVGGVPEVVADGVSGLFSAPGDVATLQRQLRKLLLDRKLGERMGAAARESIRLRCAPERAAARLADIYAGLGVHAVGRAPAALHDPNAPKAAL